MPGRQSKLTDEVQEAICQSIRNGNYAKVAAEAAKVSETTFYRWLEEGEKAKQGKKREFWESIKEAEAESEQNAVRVVQDAMPHDWKAAMTYLERRHPERWGKRDKQTLEHTGEGGGPVAIRVVYADD